jgi:hypothetical protein
MSRGGFPLRVNKKDPALYQNRQRFRVPLEASRHLSTRRPGVLNGFVLALTREPTIEMESVEQDTAQPFALTDVDRQILGQTNEEFKAHTWEELRHIIGEWELGG